MLAIQSHNLEVCVTLMLDELRPSVTNWAYCIELLKESAMLFGLGQVMIGIVYSP